MKLLRLPIILSLCLLGSQLTGCTGIASGLSGKTNSPGNSKTVKVATTSKKISRQNGKSSFGITLDDFSNLNLNNDSAESQGNLWEEMRSGLKIPNPESHPEVQQQIRWFTTHPGYLQRTTERARPYMYIVYDEVKKRGLPMELVLLPINESGYYPFSYSTAGATGIWQLMPGTASNFGLKHDFWYDGRRDIFDSTNAALDYLTYLANYFNGDWLLAIAAYDTGEGNVENAIARNVREGKPTDFWSLHLAAETRSYVPRLLALAAIIAHPDRYPVQLPPVEAKPVVAKVKINSQLKLTDAAKLAGISVNQLKVLNPGLSKFATDPSAESRILLPINAIENFKQNLNHHSDSLPPINYNHYKVQRGDNLARIAKRFHTTPEELRQINNILGRRIPPGTVLLIPNVSEDFTPSTQINLNQTSLNLPDDGNTAATSASATIASSSDSKAAATITTTVTTTATSATNSTAQQPTDDNDDSADNTTSISTKTQAAKHKVQKGETLSSIAAKNHVSVSQLKKLNPSITRHPLKPGQVIIISSTSSPARADNDNDSPAPAAANNEANTSGTSSKVTKTTSKTVVKQNTKHKASHLQTASKVSNKRSAAKKASTKSKLSAKT